MTGTVSGNNGLQPIPMIICPSVRSSQASDIVFSSPTIHGFPNTSDVFISYSRTDQLTVTFESSTSEHGLDNFAEGLTTVYVTAMDSDSNSATCQFTYTHIPGKC